MVEESQRTPVAPAEPVAPGSSVAMDWIKDYLIRNFEQLFILIILVSVAFINYFIPYKLAFLNFYYIPILLGAYYLGTRRALLGAFFCVLMVVIYALLDPESFIPGSTWLDLSMNIVGWASFLLLTSAVVGRLNERLREEFHQVKSLNEGLLLSQTSLKQAESELREYAQNLEAKVNERTDSLEKSKTAIEDLKKKVEEALYATMDASVVKLMIENRLRTEKRRISVLFSDLKDFTVYSEERRPEVVITDLNKYLEEMENVLLEYHAHIDKYMGDGIMAEFGAPIDYERHALLASVAGLKMQERLARKNFPWGMRVGIATGEPIIGLIGHQRQSYSAIGDVVNSGARIEALCVPGSVTVDDPTFEDVRRFLKTRRKTVLPFSVVADQAVVKVMSEMVAKLDDTPNDLGLLKKTSFLLFENGLFAHANGLLKRALELDPDDNQVKLAFAESSMKMAQAGTVELKGKKTRLHLYEVLGILNPLEDRDKVPQDVYDRYAARVEKLVPYPEDQLLPVECLDGCVGHGRGVGFWSFALADVLNLHDREKQDALAAGYVADIGKAIVPHHLLNRSGTLNKSEFQEVIKHPREGERILKGMGYQTEAVLQIVAAHHEHFNGGGYPGGLKGEEIPMGARIVAVADSYDALTSWRPYRDRWEFRAAYTELQKDTRSGKFDPRVMDALGKLLGLA